MAGRVNTKFVVMLSVGLLVVACAAGALAYTALQKRPAGWVAKGDALVASGNFDEAAKYYERAVGKDGTNLEWLEKWRDTLVKTTPNNRARYEAQYQFYRGILRKVALLKSRDPEAQLAYIREIDTLVRSSGLTRDGLEHVAKEASDRLRDLDPSAPGTLRLKRYRAAAVVDRMAMIKTDEEEKKQALQDLEEVVAGDPTDYLGRVYLARWHSNEADRYRADRQPELEAEPRAKAREIINALEKDMGSQPEVALAVFAARQGERLRSVATTAEQLKIVSEMRGEALRVADITLSVPADQLTVDHVDRVFNTLLRVVGQEALAPLESLIDRALQVHPTDAQLMIDKGMLLQESQKYEESIAQLQRVVDLPDLPVSLNGLLLSGQRMTAMALQIDSALFQWNDGRDDASRAEALNRAKRFRDQLAKDAGMKGKEQLLLRDAKIAFAERRYDETVAKISELKALNQSAGSSIQVLQILAQALQQQQNFGEARRVLNDMLDVAPSMAWTHAQLAEVYLRLGQIEDAQLELFAATRLEPENQAYKDRLKTILTATGAATEEGMSDPVVKGLIEARKLRDEVGDTVRTREKLNQLQAQFPDDRRVFNDLVALDLREGLKAEAIARVEAALAKYPDDNMLKRTLSQLKIEDPTEAALSFIDSSDYSPAIKAIERYKVFIQAGRKEEAAAALAEAEKAGPEDPGVIDMAFVDALGRRDFGKALALTKTAARLDLDQLGGLLYQGRLQLIEGEGNPEKLQAAVRTFEDAVKRVPLNPTIRKLQAQAYLRVGRTADAADAYKRALEGKPDDVVVSRDYINLLLQLNRGKDALAAVSPDTGILKFFPANRELLLVWMDLEGRYGDRSKALEAREAMYKLEPASTANTYALANLYVEDERWADAERLLTDLDKREDVNRLGLANLRASMLAKRGDIDGGVQAIRSVITDDIAPRQKTMAYLAMADFLRRNGRPDEASAAMRKAKETQDSKVMEADRALGDLMFEAATAKSQDAAKMEDAEEPELAEKTKAEANELLKQALVSYEAVYAAAKDNPADAMLLGKRMAETYLRLHDFKRAKELVAAAAKVEPEDMQVLLLYGAIASEEGDRRGAKVFYDRAVTLYPSNPNAFFQRALFNMSVEDPDVRKTMLSDILQDLEQVTKLRPGLVTAWTRRYTLLREVGRNDEAVAVLRSAIASNPDVDDLRLMLIKDLAREGMKPGNERKLQEMQTELVRAANERPEERRWLRLGARILAQPSIGRYREASELLEKYWEKDPLPEVAPELLDAYLRPNQKPTRQRIQQLMVEFEKIANPKNLFDTMLKARARAYTGQNDLSEKHLNEGLAIIENDGQGGQLFFSYLIAVKGTGQSALDWLKNKMKSGPINPVLENMVIGSARGTEEPQKIIEKAKSLLARCSDPVSQVEVLRTLSGTYYTSNRFEESADAALQAIKILEQDPRHLVNPVYMELLNNLAYTMVTQLNKPQEGLPYAEKAAELMPNTPTVLDTLGWAYHKTKNHTKAVEVLSKSMQMSTSKYDGFIAAVHLGMAQLAAGDKVEARRSLRKADEFAADPDPNNTASQIPEYKALHEELRKGVE
ncbi:MAG: tetratricopeptide repeat protein [Phycisphaerae bacterium]|nr:tetratricopeptide repeat protein [Phycisphaerae bacterium]